MTCRNADLVFPRQKRNIAEREREVWWQNLNVIVTSSCSAPLQDSVVSLLREVYLVGLLRFSGTYARKGSITSFSEPNKTHCKSKQCPGPGRFLKFDWKQ
ncbi:hypothetical protein J6590_030927 [Homalodisca vitripennis]|nr:hypothetical protein J6590_030927 [Homalodisca vitripennis]